MDGFSREVVKLDDKGRAVIPKHMREALQLEGYAEFHMMPSQGDCKYLAVKKP